MRDRRISAYFATRNQASQVLELADVVSSYLAFASEVVICDVGSDDGTWEELLQLATRENRVRLLRYTGNGTEDEAAMRGALGLARDACRGAYAFEGAPSLCVDEQDASSFDSLIDRLNPRYPVLALPVLRFRGGNEHIRRDVPLSHPCLSRNDPTITHGEEGYIDRVNGEAVACLETIPAHVDLMRHDGSSGQDLVQAIDDATKDVPVLWCHEQVRDILPPHRVPRDLVPKPERRDRVLRPHPKALPLEV